MLPCVHKNLLGKILGPIGFAQALVRGTFPPEFGWTILTNDLLWWWPFAAILVTMLYDGRTAVFATMTLAILLGGQWALRESNTIFFGVVGGVVAGSPLVIEWLRQRGRPFLFSSAVTVPDGSSSGGRSDRPTRSAKWRPTSASPLIAAASARCG